MPKPKPEPEPVCACGRKQKEAVARVYQAHAATFVFHRCPCGLEWTERCELVDRSEPVSTDEVIEVHQYLAAFHGSISELLSLPTA